jgi:hypothetical protein
VVVHWRRGGRQTAYGVVSPGVSKDTGWGVAAKALVGAWVGLGRVVARLGRHVGDEAKGGLDESIGAGKCIMVKVETTWRQRVVVRAPVGQGQREAGVVIRIKVRKGGAVQDAAYICRAVGRAGAMPARAILGHRGGCG